MIAFIVLLASILTVAFFRFPAIAWTAVLGAELLIMSFFGFASVAALTLYWTLYLVAGIFANVTPLRQRLFTKPLLNILKKRLPPMSATEREAIAAGHAWWEKELFSGRPVWKNFLEMPQPALTEEEQSFLDNQVETLCGMLNEWDITFNNHNLPPAVWDYLKSERFFGLVIPREFGGHGFSAIAHSAIIVKLGTRSVSTAVNTMVPNSLGPAELIYHYGTEEQKHYYLPRLADGQDIPCFGLTAPDAGSDAGSITDSGVICRDLYQGKEVLGIRLNWDKRYITLAPVATVLGLAFQLYDPNHLIGDKEELGITLCLVPTDLPGVEIGNRHLPLHLAFMNGPVRGKNVFVPIEAIIGGVEMAGHGWKMLMESLSIGRSISLPALSTACGNVAFRVTGAYAKLRKQFNTSIANFEGVEEALSYIAGYAYLLESCRRFTASAVDQHVRPSVASAIAKYHMTEMARKMVACAMDIHGGHAIQVGPRNLLAEAHLAIPISITVEGANILTRNLIIFGQGSIRCHPYLLQEMNLLAEPDSQDRLKKLDHLLMSHVGYTISHGLRSLLFGLTGGKLLRSPVKGPAAKYYRQLTRMSSALAFVADICLLLLGGNLKRKERISARLGDILSELYLASAVLKYYQVHYSTTDTNYMSWCVQSCLHHIQVACNELFENFPNRFLGSVLRAMIFPWGSAYRKPSDALSHAIVKAMISPSELRDRLTPYFYLSKKENDPTKRMEWALAQIDHVEPLAKKFQLATREGKIPKVGTLAERIQFAVDANILTIKEARILRNFETLRGEVIKVDEFSFDLNSVES